MLQEVFKLKPKIYNTYFTAFEEQEDMYRDAEGRGLLQRYVEVLADEWDSYSLELLQNILGNVLVPDTAHERFIPYLEQALGLPVFVTDMIVRRKIVKNFFDLVSVKGTITSYELLLSLLGFSEVRLDFISHRQGFDSLYTFDDSRRVFDSGGCMMCAYYDLHLNYDGIVYPDLFEVVRKAVDFVEPITAKLVTISINGVENNHRFFISEETGDLHQIEQADTTDVFIVSAGDLIARSNENYVINNGDIYKQ